ncbi:hypothetical protein [Bradyrhizobium sp.]|uniref:hypothetical protein n=1 Tax=Bradyrhizobium sp. TaxID=376 RepID=UPI002734EA56|nr:hypothetical protein [Bradyrhizobium sp.]MDP3078678.1 hypothetical protein [Bradyrhizobium sp.]
MPKATKKVATPASEAAKDVNQGEDNQEDSAEDVIFAQAELGQGGLSLVPTKKVKKNHTVEVLTLKGKSIERDGFTVVKAKK